MIVDIDETMRLSINGLQIPITQEQSRRIYHQLFMLFMQAYGRELRIRGLLEETVEEAEEILRQGEDK